MRFTAGGSSGGALKMGIIGHFQASIPVLFLYFCQEVVELGGVEQVVRAAHFRLCYSRKMFVVAYLREA
ncbi:MAG: hypothetical protein KIT26_08135 [Nitrosomonas sp.]|nr:hypothetical protein [Nitrosomonas sp.]